MMLRQILMVWLGGLLALTAAETDGPGKFRLDEAGAARERPTVEETGRVLLIEDADGRQPNTPRGSFAALATLPGKRIEWTPSPDPGRATGGARLTDAALAPDESALLLLEKVGAGDGPFGSRIVLFNLYNGRVANVLALADRDLAGIALPPGCSRIIALQRPQEALEQARRLLLIHPKTGRIAAEFPVLEDEVSSWLATDEAIWVKTAGDETLLKFSPDDPSAPPRRFRLAAPGGLLLVAGDGATLLHATAGRLDVWREAEETLKAVRHTELPEDFVPDCGAAISADGRSAVLARRGGAACSVLGDAVRPLADGIGCAPVWNEAERALVLSLEKRHSLELCRLPEDPQPRSAASATGTAPRTTGEPRWIFAASGRDIPVLVVDHRSNIYRMTPDGRRWRKTELRRAEPAARR